MKALTRIPIFNYSSMVTTLLTDTKSLEIKLRSKFITTEMLFELESVLAWTAAHHEVQSLFITCYGDTFIQGFDPEEIKTFTEEKIKKQISKLSILAQSFMCLPQTVIVDVRGGARGVGVELALAADIRLATKEAQFCFDYLSQGLTPACGLFSFLTPYLNQNVVRSLLMSGRNFSVETFALAGGYCETDSSQKVILQQIFAQAPVARIQAKRGMLGETFNNGSAKMEEEKQIFNAVTVTRDYTKESDFMSSQDYKSMLQQAGLEA